MTTRPAVVRRVRRETADTVTLETEVDGLATFAPGQFDMLYAFGAGESAISISSAPDDAPLVSHTIRSVGTVTSRLTSLAAGDVLGVRGPFGRGWPVADAHGGDLVVVAGGIGLAPLRPVVRHALAHRDRFRRVVVLVGARTPQDLLFADELARWAGDPRLELRVTVDRAEPGWTGRVGVVTGALERTALDPDRTTLLSCGPEVMMRFVARAALVRGVPAAQLHVSLERTMRCGVGTCGHCQLGPLLLCRDGPVMAWPEVAGLLEVREL